MPPGGMQKKKKYRLGLEDLPDDILFEIFLRLPSESVCIIRSVSKNFCKLVDGRPFATLHELSAAAGTAEVPRLLITIQSDFFYEHPDPLNQENSNALQLLKYDAHTSSLSSSSSSSSLLGNNAYDSSNVVKIFNLGDFQVRSVFRNLFCFASKYLSPKEELGNGGRQSCFLFNPLAQKGGEILMLPRHPKNTFNAYGMGMGIDDKTKILKLKIVGIPIMSTGAAYIYELGTNSTSWRPIPPSPASLISHLMGVSAFGNMYYWIVPRLGNQIRILSFDFSREEFSWIPHPEFTDRRGHSLHLVNLRGSLAAVDTVTPSKQIEIWVLTDPNKQWTLAYKIQKDACLTGPHRGLLKYCGEWEHGLFFVQSHGKEPTATSTNAVFWDFRCGGSFKRVFFPDNFGDGRQRSEWAGGLISFTGSMISLKHYGDLLQHKAGEWHIDFENTEALTEAITAC